MTRQTATFHLWPLNAFAHKKFDTSADMGESNAMVIMVGLAMALFVAHRNCGGTRVRFTFLQL
jgi:hypothetical protein